MSELDKNDTTGEVESPLDDTEETITGGPFELVAITGLGSVDTFDGLFEPGEIEELLKIWPVMVGVEDTADPDELETVFTDTGDVEDGVATADVTEPEPFDAVELTIAFGAEEPEAVGA